MILLSNLLLLGISNFALVSVVVLITFAYLMPLFFFLFIEDLYFEVNIYENVYAP